MAEEPFPVVDVLGDVLIVTARTALPGISRFHTFARMTKGDHRVVWVGNSDTPRGALREHRKGRAWAAQHLLLTWIQGDRSTTVGEVGELFTALSELGKQGIDLDDLHALDLAVATARLRDAVESRIAEIDNEI